MEFGSKQCRPHNPGCENCPLASSCVAFEKGLVKKLPVKNKNRKAATRYFHYLHFEQGSYTWLMKRTGTDIWKNLYEFPLLETNRKMPARSVYSAKKWRELVPRDALVNAKTQFTHQLSHQTIYATFYRLKLKDKSTFILKGAKKIRQKDVGRLPVHRLLDKYLQAAFSE
jgi:A/G-specific adenine glycosylase